MAFASQDIHDYEVVVKQNGTEIPFSSYRIRRSSDSLNHEWRLTFGHPRVVNSDDEFTIIRSFAGIDETIVEAQVPLKWDGKDAPFGMTRTISGYVEPTIDMEIAPTKDLFFINPDYLDDVIPGGWMLDQDGLIYYDNKADHKVYSNARVFAPFLPKKSEDGDMVECITTYRTYREIAQYLATQLGVRVFVNVPDVPVLKVLKVPSSQSYWDTLQRMFSVWNPHWQVYDDPTSGVELHCLDAYGKASGLQKKLIMKLEKRAFRSISFDQTAPRENKIVNHVTIKGATAVNRTIIMNDDEECELRRLDEIELSIDYVKTVQGTFDYISEKKTMGDDKRDIGHGSSARQQYNITGTSTTYYYHIDDQDDSKWIIVMKDVEMNGEQGRPSLQRTEYHYAKGYRLIGTTETEYMLYRPPGKAYWFFDAVTVKHSDSSWVIMPMKNAITDELTEELVVIEEREDPTTGTNYIASAQRLKDAVENGQVEYHPGTVQQVVEMTTSFSKTTVERETDSVLSQTKTTYDRLSGAVKVYSQVISNPKKPISKGVTNEDKVQYRKDFYYGNPPYRVATVVEHPDVNTDALAQAISDRVFARSAEQKKTLKVDLTSPLPLKSMTMAVHIPNITVTARRGAEIEEMVSTYGTYMLTDYEETGSMSQGNLKVGITIDLRNVL